MNTAVAIKPAERISPVEAYRMQVLPPEKANDLWRSLPAHIKPAVFERNLLNALMANPDLLSFPPPLVYREVSKAAGLGLLLDPQLGEAYIVTAYNYKTKRVEPQLRIGYKGMCKLARQAGDVANIYAHEVCANDPIECHQGTEKRLIHTPCLFGDRGDVVGYYAVIKWKDGNFDFEPMSVAQCRGIRDRSDAWKAFKDGKIKSTPWATDEEEMSKKTTLRRLMKRQAQSPELAEAIKIEDEAEFLSMREPRPIAPKPPSPDTPALVAPTETPIPMEPIKDEPPAEVVAPKPPNPTAKAEPHPLDDIPPQFDRRPKPMPSATDDTVAWLKWLDTKLGGIKDGGAFETFWNDTVAPIIDQLFPPDQEDAMGIYRKHEARLAP